MKDKEEETNAQFNQKPASYSMDKKFVKFFFLTLDLPNVPLFKEQQELGTLPQINLLTLMKKYDGITLSEEVQSKDGVDVSVKRKYIIKKLPKYLFLHIKRFSKNNFFKEKNPMIVSFPLRDLDLGEFVAGEEGVEKPAMMYDLVGSVIHTGKADSGTYKVQAIHEPSQEWHDIQDLLVDEIMPQQVTVSESYILLFKKR